MKKVSTKDIERLENALGRIYHEDESPPEPSLKWQQNVMRQVRQLPLQGQENKTLPLILKDLCWPTAQLVMAMVVLIGVYLLNDASLTNLDMSLFYSEVQLSGENLISYYSF